MKLAVRVQLRDAQDTRKALDALGVVDYTRRPTQRDGYLLIPVTKAVEGYEVVEEQLKERKAPTPDLKTALAEHLTEDELADLKTAYDLVGDIAILEIDEELRHKETLIAQTLLELQPPIKTVVRKDGAHSGELRLQDYAHLAGEERFETTVVENGVRLTLDIRKTYYSVRSSTERKRVASLVQPGERVLCMFSGIGPFPLVISALSEAQEILGVELNEHAHRYAEQNVAQNKAQNVRVLHGDVREVVSDLGTFDRVTMPLPHTAQDFLDVAIPACNSPAMIHLYHFSSEEEVNALAKKIPERIAQLVRPAEVVDIVRCGSLAPGIYRWSIDIRV